MLVCRHVICLEFSHFLPIGLQSMQPASTDSRRQLLKKTQFSQYRQAEAEYFSVSIVLPMFLTTVGYFFGICQRFDFELWYFCMRIVKIVGNYNQSSVFVWNSEIITYLPCLEITDFQWTNAFVVQHMKALVSHATFDCRGVSVAKVSANQRLIAYATLQGLCEFSRDSTKLIGTGAGRKEEKWWGLRLKPVTLVMNEMVLTCFL